MAGELLGGGLFRYAEFELVSAMLLVRQSFVVGSVMSTGCLFDSGDFMQTNLGLGH